MQNQQLNEAITKIDIFAFLRDFSVDEQAAKLRETLPELAPYDAERLLRLVKLTKDSEKSFFIGPITHPLAKHHDFANVPTIELSEHCFRLGDWADYLCKQFPELGREIVNRVINRYVYLRHLR